MQQARENTNLWRHAQDPTARRHDGDDQPAQQSQLRPGSQLFLQRYLGNGGMQGAATCESGGLHINEPGDIFEQEADRVAAQVTNDTETQPAVSAAVDEIGAVHISGDSVLHRWGQKDHAEITVTAGQITVLDPDLVRVAANHSAEMDFTSKRIFVTGPRFVLGMDKGEGPEHGEDGNYSSTDRDAACAQNLRVQRHYLNLAVQDYLERERMLQQSDDIDSSFLTGASTSSAKRFSQVDARHGLFLGHACHIAQDRGSHGEGVKGAGHNDSRTDNKWDPDDKTDNAVGYREAVNNTAELFNEWKRLTALPAQPQELRRCTKGHPHRSIAPQIVHDVLRSPGQPLDAATRASMEPRFGHDLSQVRVHTDARAAKSADEVNALAYTVGSDVVFGARQYAPGTSEGRRLMAHELTHVVQQSQKGRFVQRQSATITQGDPQEKEAEQKADKIQRTFVPVPDDQTSNMNADIEHIRALLKGADLSKKSKVIILEIIEKWYNKDLQARDMGSRGTEYLDQFLVLLKTQTVTREHWYGVLDQALIFDDLWYKLDGYWLEKYRWLIDKSQKQRTDRPALAKERGLLHTLAKQEAIGLWGMLKGMGTSLAGMGDQIPLLIVNQMRIMGVDVPDPPSAAAWLATQYEISGEALFGKEFGEGSLISGMNAADIGSTGGTLISNLVTMGKSGSGSVALRGMLQGIGLIGNVNGVIASARRIAEIIIAAPDTQSAIHNTDMHIEVAKLAANIFGVCSTGASNSRELSAKVHLAMSIAGLTLDGAQVAAMVEKLVAIYASKQSPAEKEQQAREVMLELLPAIFGTAISVAGLQQPSPKAGDNNGHISPEMQQGQSAHPHEPTQTTPSADTSKQKAEAPAISSNRTIGSAETRGGSETASAISKEDAISTKPTVDGHEAVVTRQGVGACSPSPCPVIHVKYKKELAENPALREWNEKVQELRKVDSTKAVEEARDLILALEKVRSNTVSLSLQHAEPAKGPKASPTRGEAQPASLKTTSPNEYLLSLRQRVHSARSEGGKWDYDLFPCAPTGSTWKHGDPIDMPDSTGTYPTFDTARKRYWKNRAHFEMEARSRKEAIHDSQSQDPMRRLSDGDLQAIRDSGKAPPAPGEPGRHMELEHGGVPQRVRNWLESLGFSKTEARRRTHVSDPRMLEEVTPLEHAFRDAEAHSFGSQRADVEGNQWQLTLSSDDRVSRPLFHMESKEIVSVIRDAQEKQFNFEANAQTRKLRDALREEIRERNLDVSPP